MNKQILEDFVNWARYCGEDAFYIFDYTEEAIKRFLNEEYFV